MRRHIARVGLLLAAFGAVAGCSSGPEGGPVFNNEGGVELSCMAHQAEKPGTRYTDKATRERLNNTGEIFAMLKYYTSNGKKPYCDGAPASENDKAWGTIYDQLGGTAEAVFTVLG